MLRTVLLCLAAIGHGVRAGGCDVNTLSTKLLRHADSGFKVSSSIAKQGYTSVYFWRECLKNGSVLTRRTCCSVHSYVPCLPSVFGRTSQATVV